MRTPPSAARRSLSDAKISRSFRGLAAAVVGGTLLVALPTLAHADVVAPDQAICNGKILGDTCTLTGGGSGTCQSRDCSRKVATADGGTTVIQRTCVECIGSGAADSGTDQGGSVKGGGCSVRASDNTSFGNVGVLGLALTCFVVAARRKRHGAKSSS